MDKNYDKLTTEERLQILEKIILVESELKSLSELCKEKNEHTLAANLFAVRSHLLSDRFRLMNGDGDLLRSRLSEKARGILEQLKGTADALVKSPT